MPELVIARHGHYLVVQGTNGWEIREDFGAKQRNRWFVGGFLLGMSALAYTELATEIALVLAMVGGVIILTTFGKRGRAFVIDDGELRYAEPGDIADRRAAWPRSDVAKVVVEQVGVRPRAVDRGRRPGPRYIVRIVSRDGRVHPARFSLRSKDLARTLAELIAGKIGVSVEAIGDR
jgi:hypothetical protein